MVFGFRKRNSSSNCSSGGSSGNSKKYQDILDNCDDANYLKKVIKDNSDVERRTMAFLTYNVKFFPNSNMGDVLSDLCLELNLTQNDVLDISKQINKIGKGM